MNTYEHTRNGIIKAGFSPEVLEGLAGELAHATSLEQAKRIYSVFEIEAEKLPWPQDHDFGALTLQKQASNAPILIAKFMMTQAIKRAEWCATCATSGGEGLARSAHIKELINEKNKYN